MAKLNFMEVHICQRKHVHDIIVNPKHSSYFPYFFHSITLSTKNLYIISSSIKKFFMSTKTFILSKTETKLHFPQNSFVRTLIKKLFLYPFHSLSSKLFRKFKIRSLQSNCSKSSKDSRGARGANYFHYHFYFRFHSCESVFTCKFFSFSFSFSFYYYFPFSWKCIYIHKNLD